MKKTWILIMIIGFGYALNAQNDMDAFLFSQTDYQGTARYMGACGAFSATGGDFSALNSNPAAIGLFKRCEISFTPTVISLFKDNTTYYGNDYATYNPKYTLSEFGFVLNSNIDNSKWKTWQFGAGYNRIMDFNNTFHVEGLAQNSSLIDQILHQSGNTTFGSLTGDALLAWNTFMIDTLAGTDNQYYSPFGNLNTKQSCLTKTSGGIDEISLSFGGNYNDQLFVGATVGIPILHYSARTNYTESPADAESVQGISSYQLNTIQEDDGTGINLKLGVIYQPWQFLRIGAAFQTPTFYWNIKDSYYREMISYHVNDANSGWFSYTNDYNYSLTTPLKANLSLSFIIKKRAFIAAEYEFTDYGMTTMYANDYSFMDENEAIDSKYGACHTFRVGGEINLTPNFVIRAGYSFKTSPYITQNGRYNAAANYASLGFGFRGKYCFVDLGYVLKYSRDMYWLYDADYVNPCELTNTTHRIVATIGYKF